MKKNVIALLLAVVMASSSVGSIPVVAAETAASEAVIAEETAAEEENAPGEESVEGATAADVTEAADEAAIDDGGSAESVQDQDTESESEALDEEQETVEEDDTEESSGPNDYNPDEVESQEAAPQTSSENELTADQIRAFQEKINIWKYDNQITIVYDSSEDAKISYHLYSVKDGELLYEGNLHRIEENGLYYEAVDFDAVNEAENRETNRIDISDISVKAIIEVAAEQDDESLDSNAYSIEEVVSDETGIVSMTEVDTETEGKITGKWDCTGGKEIDGYSVIVRLTEREDAVLVYDTDQLTDNADDSAYTLDADHQITLNIEKESVSDIAVTAYRFDDETGVKQYGKAASGMIVEDEESAVTEEEAIESETKEAALAEGDVVESGTCGDNLTWTLTGTEPDLTLTISGSGKMNDWKRATLDPPWYSRRAKIKTVVVENGVTSIGNYAFEFCSLTSITIPNGVTSIGDHAFYRSDILTSITIPNSVTSIGGFAFTDCSSLTSITIPDSVTSIGDYAFYGCRNLTSITIPNGVTTIGERMFYDCYNLTSITIPESVTSIGYYAFGFCNNLASITIPESVTSIGEWAFRDCIGLTSITIPESVTNIGSDAFYGCYGLTSITIPKGVTRIGPYTFCACSNLEEVYYYGSETDWEAITIEYGNDPLLNARKVFIDASSSIELSSEITCQIDETISVTATYTSSQNTSVTASVKSDVGSALELSSVTVEGPYEGNPKYVSYIKFNVTGKMAGEYNLTLTASDGTTAKTVVKVEQIDISNASVKLNCPDVYNEGYDCVLHTGSKVEPEILEVKVNGKLLTRNKDYTASYTDNINCGEARVTLNGIGNYKGQKIADFYIVPEKVTNLRYCDTACGHNENNNVGAKHRALEVAWDNKYVNVIAGYSVEYSEDRAFPDDDTARLDVESTRCYTEGLDRDTVYYVRVTPCIIVGTCCLFGEQSDVFEYRSCNHLIVKDFWGFGNCDDHLISEEYFKAFFTPAQAAKMAANNNVNGGYGLCFGFSNAAISILDNKYPELSSLGVESLWDIKGIDVNTTARKYIYYVYTLQGEAVYTGFNHLNELADRVRDYTANGGEPVDIALAGVGTFTGRKEYGHNVVCLDLVEETNTKATIRVYDCNNPGKDMFLKLYKSNEDGGYDEWSYENLEGLESVSERQKGLKNDYIRYLQPGKDEMITSMLKSYLASDETPLSLHRNHWLLCVNNEQGYDTNFFKYLNKMVVQNNGSQIETSGAELTSEEKQVSFWVPIMSEDTLNLEGVPAGTEIHLAGNMHSVSVQTDAECDLSIFLPETGEGEVHASSDDAFEIHAVFMDFDEDGDRTKTSYTESGNAQTPVEIDKHAGDPDAPLYSGTCGSNLTWSFDESGILRISGTGAMYDYGLSSNKAPWLKPEIMNSLKSVIIKNGVTKIGDYAFTICYKSTSVWIPNSVVSIGKYAFSACRGLEKVTIPEGVTSIGQGAFNDCSGIDTIKIPSSVESIGNMAFSGCTSLNDITVNSDNATYSSINGILFSKDGTELICCPAGKKGLYSIPDGVVKIGKFAFDECSGLTGVSIPDGVSIIDGYAFGGCSGLTSMAIPSSVTDIMINACNNCSKLSQIYFIGTQEEWNSININSINSVLLAVRKIFVDDPKSLSYAEVPEISNMEYTGRAIKPKFEVHQLCTLLERGKDYTVSYSDNVNAGTATVTISGAGEYTGSVTASFVIDPKPISSLEVSGITAKTFNGKAQTQAIVVNDGIATLVEGKDYVVAYENNVHAGTASVVITGKGNYTGTVTKTFTIKKAPNTITAKNFTKTYSTKAQSFSLGVKLKNGTPTYKSSTKSVTVSAKGAVTIKPKFIGKATITITSPEKANYSKQTKKITITVNPTKTALVSVASPSAGKMTVKWKKNAVGTGYQIQFSTSSKFTSPKSATITKNTTLSKTIGGLVKGKKYYVRIRTYKTVGKTKFYSGWSAVKAVTIKK